MIIDVVSYVREEARWVIYLAPFLLSWTVWKIWMFKIKPGLYRDEIDVLPYNIPCGCPLRRLSFWT